MVLRQAIFVALAPAVLGFVGTGSMLRYRREAQLLAAVDPEDGRRPTLTLQTGSVKTREAMPVDPTAATAAPEGGVGEETENEALGASGGAGSVGSAAALVAGTTVGAGILALPAATVGTGFLPSSAMLCFMWAYMSATGLLIAEVAMNLKDQGAGILASAEATIGAGGARVAGAAYLFIHYALLVAYCAQGGAVLSPLAAGFGPVAFAALFGGALFALPPRTVEAANNAAVAVVVASFLGLLGSAAGAADPARLLAADLGKLPGAIPTMFVALVFHNVVPVIVAQLGADRAKVRTAILGGSALPAAMFLLWNGVVLAATEPGAAGGPAFNPVDALGGGEGALGLLVPAFTEVAILTSFVGFVYGLLDFYIDAFRIDRDGGAASEPGPARAALFAGILAPPAAVASVNPDIFLGALDTAGTFGISVLFGILPAAMAFRQRAELSTPAEEQLVPGGNAALLGIMGFAGLVIVQQTAEKVGALL